MLTIGGSCANIKSSIKDVANIFSVFPGGPDGPTVSTMTPQVMTIGLAP